MSDAGRLDNLVGDLVRELATVHGIAAQVRPGGHVYKLTERSYDLVANGRYVTIKLAQPHGASTRMVSLRFVNRREPYVMEQLVSPVAAVVAFSLK
jgi:hypothetical protein